MAKGMIHRLIEVFMDAAKGMGVDCECSDIEGIAVMIHRAMSYQSRQFHTLEHVFGFLDGADHETALAAAFHDLVYFQVDDGLPPDLEGMLGAYLVRDGSDIRLSKPPQGADADVSYSDCLAIFDFEPGQKIQPFGGLNEFLSALAMAKSLERHLPRPTIAAIATSIEATIPFRGAYPDGSGIGEALEARLGRLTREKGLEMDSEAIVAAVRRAIAFANVDVKDFALPDAGLFLSNTWKLLPESNAALRRRGAFSIREYRLSLAKMQLFFRSLKPENIYHSYRALPSPDDMAALVVSASRNLEHAQAYMQAKLLAVGLIEAVAELSGGDAPMALFMGDLPQGRGEEESLTTFLPALPTPAWICADHPVYRLLKDGRLDESSFDLKNSPLALFLYNRMPPNAWGQRAKAVDEFFARRMTAEDFFLGFDPSLRSEFAAACMHMVPTREKPLRAWLEAHPGG